MKKFRFPLRPVAVVRAHVELRAREQLAAAIHAYVEAEERLATTRVRITRLEDGLFSNRGNLFRATEAAELYRIYRSERQAEIVVERGVIEARDSMEKRRKEYLEAHRQLEAVNRLEQRARGRHRAYTIKMEQAQIDETAGYAMARRTALP
jgi:flagellar FliJ protein